MASPCFVQAEFTQREPQIGNTSLSSQIFNEDTHPLYNLHRTLPYGSANLFHSSTQYPGDSSQENFIEKSPKTDCTNLSSTSTPTEHALGSRRKEKVPCDRVGCQQTLTRASLKRHQREVHEGKKRKKTRERASHYSISE